MLSRESLQPRAGATDNLGVGERGRCWALWNASKQAAPVSWFDELPLTFQLKCHFFQETLLTPAHPHSVLPWQHLPLSFQHLEFLL